MTPKYIPFRDIPARCWPTFVLALAALLLVMMLACGPDPCPPGHRWTGLGGGGCVSVTQ